MGRVQLKARNRVGVRTGKTMSSIRKQNRFQRAQVSVDVVAGWRGAKHIGVQEFGSAPHIIQVRSRGRNSRKALRFTVGGQVVFRTRVRHPGTRGTRFLTSSLPLAGGGTPSGEAPDEVLRPDRARPAGSARALQVHGPSRRGAGDARIPGSGHR